MNIPRPCESCGHKTRELSPVDDPRSKLHRKLLCKDCSEDRIRRETREQSQEKR